jgi:hypothetical protein
VAPQHGSRSQGEVDRRVQLGWLVSVALFHSQCAIILTCLKRMYRQSRSTSPNADTIK